MFAPSMSVGIAGAGIMGRLMAFALVNRGYQVTLFDKDPIEQGSAAAFTAAGMLTPFAEIESAEKQVFQLGVRSLAIWPQIIRQLNADVGFYQSGSLVVAHHQDKPDLLRFDQLLQSKLNDIDQLVVNNPQTSLNKQALAQLEPALAENFSQATFLPDEAWLSPDDVMLALANYLQENGINWLAGVNVESLSARQIITQQQSFNFDWVIDCRGLGAKPQWPQIRGVRGEVIVLQAPEVKISRLVRLMHPRYRLYLVPRMHDDIYLIGATQIESQDMGAVSVRSALELLSAVYCLHGGFAEARVLKMRSNCRPALPDNLPKVQISPGLIKINGLFRHGFLLAPAIAQEVLQWLDWQGALETNFTGLFSHV
ncbi:glycine oxidase ThiO [Aliikangiella maris]|uniref:Glycine oxidase ThiO n=2 Tax=Aliikangiella maris TaxID=3162458 RepID=A0ABV3MMB6_9GAMM